MLSKIRAHHWGILIAIVIALVLWLARPRRAGEPTSQPGTQKRRAAAAHVDEQRRHHDEVAAKIRQAAPTATLDAAYLQGCMRELQPLLNDCFERSLRAHPNSQGRMEARFDIAGEPSAGGIVDSLEFTGTAEPELQACVRGVVETQTFAPPASGGRAKVTYPFATDKPVR